jgi:hypothetical protein
MPTGYRPEMMTGQAVPQFNQAPAPYNTAQQQYNTAQQPYNNTQPQYNPTQPQYNTAQYNQAPPYNAREGTEQAIEEEDEPEEASDVAEDQSRVTIVSNWDIMQGNAHCRQQLVCTVVHRITRQRNARHC